MSTSASKLRTEILAALRGSSDLAALCGNLVSPQRVFDGDSPMQAGRNRGRLPFFEVFIVSQGFSKETPEGGTMSSRVTISAHCAGRDDGPAQDLLSGMIVASLKAIRNAVDSVNGFGGYFTDGDEEIGDVQKMPFAWTQSVTLVVNHSYDRSNYELG